jgi:hypothetical protein
MKIKMKKLIMEEMINVKNAEKTMFDDERDDDDKDYDDGD